MASGSAAFFRRPLGLFLQGGGVLGAWQAGALETLDEAGFSFDRIMGFSIGALNASALALGRLKDALARWRTVDASAVRLSPRLSPFSLFSPGPLREFLGPADADSALKGQLRTDLTLIVACPELRGTLNARFSPGGRGEWDGPLSEMAAASCSIPIAFPPVDAGYRGRRLRLVDGGIPQGGPFDLSPLAGLGDLLVLELIRPDEVGRRPWTPWGAIDASTRREANRLTEEGLATLAARPDAPRILRLAPSRRLETLMLDFRAAGVKRMLAQGAEDARAFLARPEAYTSAQSKDRETAFFQSR